MQEKALEKYTAEEVSGLLRDNVDAIVLVDTIQGKYSRRLKIQVDDSDQPSHYTDDGISS